MSKKRDDDHEGGRASPSTRKATVAALVLATVGGAWTYRDYITGDISRRGRQDTSDTSPSIAPQHHGNVDKDKWQKRTGEPKEDSPEKDGHGR